MLGDALAAGGVQNDMWMRAGMAEATPYADMWQRLPGAMPGGGGGGQGWAARLGGFMSNPQNVGLIATALNTVGRMFDPENAAAQPATELIKSGQMARLLSKMGSGRGGVGESPFLKALLMRELG
jgi:hypothetical protein